MFGMVMSLNLTNQLQLALNLSNGGPFNLNEVIPSRFRNNEKLWTICRWADLQNQLIETAGMLGMPCFSNGRFKVDYQCANAVIRSSW